MSMKRQTAGCHPPHASVCTDKNSISTDIVLTPEANGNVELLAVELGVSVAALKATGAAWDGAAWAFPERNGDGKIIGHSRRFPGGRKCFVEGERRGLTVPEGFASGTVPVLIVEGASDTAAGVDLGLRVVGRPSNTGGVEHLVVLLANEADEIDIVVIGENDKKPDGSWPGRDGAQSVARKLADKLGRSVRYALPPEGVKDLREWKKSGATKAEILAHVEATAMVEETVTLRVSGEYEETPSGIVWHKSLKEGRTIPLQLCTFTARIVESITLDDGAETVRAFNMHAICSGREYRFRLEAARFGDVAGWALREIGPAALIFPGYGANDRVRAAIQLFSQSSRERRMYRHTGWRDIDGKLSYLGGHGAIGTAGLILGVETDLSGPLAAFELGMPRDERDTRDAIGKALRVLDVAPDAVSFPVVAAAVASVLGPMETTVFLAGRTGTRKTQLAALAQAFFGAKFSGTNLPGNWLSTDNSLGALLFSAKDAFIVIDDFNPRGTAGDVQAFHRKADRVLRGQANGQGRGRCNADGTLRPDRPPRGSVLCTGEEIPTGHSLRARLLIVEVRPDDVNLTTLTECQNSAASGAFASATGGFVRWLAGEERLAIARKSMNEERARWRQRANMPHGRTPDACACLAAGFNTFLRYAVEAGAIDDKAAADYRQRLEMALLVVAERQGVLHRAEDVVSRFLGFLRSAIVSGGSHIQSMHGGAPVDSAEALGWQWRIFGVGASAVSDPVPAGCCIGWTDGDNLFLDPGAAFAQAQRMATNSGEPLGISQATFGERLKDKGLLVEMRSGRTTAQKVIAGAQRSVWVIRLANLINTKSHTPPLVDGVPSVPIVPENEGDGTDGTNGTHTEGEMGGNVANELSFRDLDASVRDPRLTGGY